MKALQNLPKRKRRSVAKQQRISRHPLHHAVRALLRPEQAEPGSAYHLIDSAPSQKYTLRTRWTTTVNASAQIVAMISPAFVEDASYPSAIVYSGSLSPGYFIQSSGAGTGLGSGVNAYKPTRPYTNVNGLSWRLVSYNLRARYSGTALNANGTIKVLNTPHGEADFLFNMSGWTYDNIRTFVESNLLSSLRTIHDRSVYDYPGIGSTEWMDGTNYFCSDITADEGTDGCTGQRVGQASSPVLFGEPGMLFSYYNSSTSATSIDFELIENWEVKGPNIAPFLTPSHGDPALHQEVLRTVLESHIHASKSGTTTANAIAFLKKANAESKTPLGKAVIAAALA